MLEKCEFCEKLKCWDCKFREKWDIENVNFAKNETLKMWILSKMRLWNCEFCEKWDIENVNFVKNETLKIVNFVKSET